VTDAEWLANRLAILAADPRYGRLMGRVTVSPALHLPTECQYRGGRVYVAGSNRDWRACENPALPMGNPVCPCQGCGPKCVGYSPEDTEGNEPCKT